EVLPEGHPSGEARDATRYLVFPAGKLRVAADGNLRIAEPTARTVEPYCGCPTSGVGQRKPEARPNPALHPSSHGCLVAPTVRTGPPGAVQHRRAGHRARIAPWPPHAGCDCVAPMRAPSTAAVPASCSATVQALCSAPPSRPSRWRGYSVGA